MRRKKDSFSFGLPRPPPRLHTVPLQSHVWCFSKDYKVVSVVFLESRTFLNNNRRTQPTAQRPTDGRNRPRNGRFACHILTFTKASSSPHEFVHGTTVSVLKLG